MMTNDKKDHNCTNKVSGGQEVKDPTLRKEISHDTKKKTMESDDEETISIKDQKKRSTFRDIPWKIYASRGLSAWGDRLWSFGAGVFMVDLDPDNLQLVAIYGLVLSVSVIIFGAYIGKWIDQSQRLKAAKIFLAIQNLSTAISCVLLALYLAKVGESSWPTWLPTLAPIITIILADIAQVASVGSKIILEKDWIVVVSRNDDDRLAQINAVFRTIDLTTLSIAPLTAGLVFDFVSNWAAAIFIAIWNLVSVIFEYLLLKSIYNEFPDLAHKKIFQQQNSNGETEVPTESILSQILTWFQGWKLYMTYPIRNAGFAMGCLYMTVLGFDNITYGFILQQCVTESILGALVGVSAIVGVTGSIMFPFLRKCMGLAKTGIFGFISLISCLSLCVVSIFLNGSPFDPYYYQYSYKNYNQTAEVIPNPKVEEITAEDCFTSSYLSVGILIAGIVLARFGLWVSDLTITQILQEKVAEEHRGIIGGIQNGMNSAMDTIKFVLVIVLPENETFGWLVIASFGFMCIGAMFYIYYAIFQHEKIKSEHLVVKNPGTVYQATATNEVVNEKDPDLII